MPSIALTNGNPDYYQYVQPDTTPDTPYHERTVIYSTLDTMVLTQLSYLHDYTYTVPAGTNLTVYALDLVILGTLRIPRGDVRIYCRRLSVQQPDDAGLSDSDKGKKFAPGIDVRPADLGPPYDKSFQPMTTRSPSALSTPVYGTNSTGRPEPISTALASSPANACSGSSRIGCPSTVRSA